ncbi:MAG: hypothetical protein ACREQY_11785 [Candidatus Binatia bacterium]
MARVKPLDPSELPTDFAAMVRQAETNGRSTALPGVLGLAPDLFRTYFRFYYPSHENGLVDTRTKEVARLKVARLNDCPT